STYTGAYFYGLDTYFEFFQVDSERKLGDSGMALAEVKPGGSARVLDVLKKVSPEVKQDMVTREVDGKHVNWFLRTSPDASLGQSWRFWVMEYAPKFLSEWHGNLRPKAVTIKPS